MDVTKKEIFIEEISSLIGNNRDDEAISKLRIGIKKGIISCNNSDSDWYNFIYELAESYFPYTRFEGFVMDFMQGIRKGEISTNISLAECYEFMANHIINMNERTRVDNAIKYFDKAISIAHEEDPKMQDTTKKYISNL